VSARRILVTGAATGIGRAVVERLTADGLDVVGAGLDADETATDNFHAVDVTDEHAITALFSEVGRLDGLVVCAGVYPPDQRLEDVSLDRFRQVLDVNLIGAFLCCRGALPLLRTAGGGSIVTISSVHAVAAAPGQGAYAASKAAITALTRQIAVDYARDGIRANSILAGSVDTRITRAAIAAAGVSEAELGLSRDPRDLGRIASPDEIAAVVAFLLSPASSFLTASALLADGGLTSRIL
jgi:NAD(P)-dependent dehydrogenase (short-subunit alcohol dehydrogenase family)